MATDKGFVAWPAQAPTPCPPPSLHIYTGENAFVYGGVGWVEWVGGVGQPASNRLLPFFSFFSCWVGQASPSIHLHPTHP